jgi:molybdate transport system ATP-binding protein
MPVPPGASKQPLLCLRDVVLYRDYRPVLQRFDWTVQAGEHWAIVGANGSGKSTLLMLLYGDLHPALGGSITRAGCKVGTPIAQWKQRVGYVSPELQADHFASGTIEQIVASGRYASVGLNQAMTAADRRTAAPWLKFFGLDAVRERGARQVSYGQMRLALLARAMVNRPQLLLLDEPFTGLDRTCMPMSWRATPRDRRYQVIMAVRWGRCTAGSAQGAAHSAWRQSDVGRPEFVLKIMVSAAAQSVLRTALT